MDNLEFLRQYENMSTTQRPKSLNQLSNRASLSWEYLHMRDLWQIARNQRIFDPHSHVINNLDQKVFYKFFIDMYPLQIHRIY